MLCRWETSEAWTKLAAELKRLKWLDERVLELALDQHPWMGLARAEVSTRTLLRIHCTIANCCAPPTQQQHHAVLPVLALRMLCGGAAAINALTRKCSLLEVFMRNVRVMCLNTSCSRAQNLKCIRGVRISMYHTDSMHTGCLRTRCAAQG
jgi:hypothetical protein